MNNDAVHHEQQQQQQQEEQEEEVEKQQQHVTEVVCFEEPASVDVSSLVPVLRNLQLSTSTYVAKRLIYRIQKKQLVDSMLNIPIKWLYDRFNRNRSVYDHCIVFDTKTWILEFYYEARLSYSMSAPSPTLSITELPEEEKEEVDRPINTHAPMSPSVVVERTVTTNEVNKESSSIKPLFANTLAVEPVEGSHGADANPIEAVIMDFSSDMNENIEASYVDTPKILVSPFTTSQQSKKDNIEEEAEEERMTPEVEEKAVEYSYR